MTIDDRLSFHGCDSTDDTSTAPPLVNPSRQQDSFFDNKSGVAVGADPRTNAKAPAPAVGGCRFQVSDTRFSSFKPKEPFCHQQTQERAAAAARIAKEKKYYFNMSRRATTPQPAQDSSNNCQNSADDFLLSQAEFAVELHRALLHKEWCERHSPQTLSPSQSTYALRALLAEATRYHAAHRDGGACTTERLAFERKHSPPSSPDSMDLFTQCVDEDAPPVPAVQAVVVGWEAQHQLSKRVYDSFMRHAADGDTHLFLKHLWQTQMHHTTPSAVSTEQPQ